MVPAVGVRSVHVKSGETNLSVISILNVFWIYPERLLKPGGDQSESIMTCSENLQRIVQPPSEYHHHSSTILLLEALQISIGTKEKCAELEEAWNSCADTAELLKEEVAEAVHGYPPVSTNVLSLKSPISFDDFP